MQIWFKIISHLQKYYDSKTIKLARKFCPFSRDVKKDSMDIHSSLGQLSQENTKHLKLRSNVKPNYPCDIRNATKTTRSIPKKVLKSLISTSMILSAPILVKFLSLQRMDSNTSHCLLMRLRDTVILYSLFHKKSDIYRVFSLIDERSIAISTIWTNQGSEYLS